MVHPMTAHATSTPLACIVLCAGKGTRMKSRLPKVLHPIAGRPLASYPLARATELGADPVVAVIGHEAERVEAALEEAFGARVKTALQAEQRGTGHAVQVGLSALPSDLEAETVLILYGDTPLLRQESLERLVALRRESGAALALLTTRLDDPTGYGRILRDAEGRVVGIVEHKDATSEQRALSEVNPGIYAVDGRFLKDSLSQISADNAQGEIYLTDLVALAAAQGPVVDLEVPAEDTLGVNDRRQLAEAARVLRRRVNERAMLAGVTLEDPDTTYLDDTVTFGQDVTLGPGVTLKGRTRIGDDVVIEQGALLEDTTVEDDAVIHAYTICEEAYVGPGAEVGPFARLRPKAELLNKAKVGNFVEVKKTRLGKGSKANHLAYLGDAVIGEGCNVGAGTITCNYDGFGKHPTVLGDRVFIGSNSTLVAPLTVADDAYVGAGSCISRDVPKDALALSRARQENKEGYAERIRRRNASRAGKKVH